MEYPGGVSTNWYESPWEAALGRTPLCWTTKDESMICQESKQLAPLLEQLVVELVAEVLVPAQVLQFQLVPSPVLVPKVPSLVPVQPIP